MSDVDEENARRVRTVLESADEPLSTGRIQRRAAASGRDIARSVVREVCEELVEAGEVERVGDPPRERYRLA